MNNKVIDTKLVELSELLDNPMESYTNKELDDEVFKALKKVNGLTDYLKSILGKDTVRYFNAPTDSARENIKGHYTFAIYLLGKITKSLDK